MNHFLEYIQNTWLELAIFCIYFATLQYFFGKTLSHMSIWKAIAISTSLPFAFCIGWLGYLYLTSPLLPDRRGFPKTKIEWRTEIKESDEPATWPFIETSYMLGCLGADSDYSVYLVKLEDISFAPGRASNFQPQYYSLKGSWNGWKKGETQLSEGQSIQVFEKYVNKSLRLCKEAEARKDGLTKRASLDKIQK